MTAGRECGLAGMADATGEPPRLTGGRGREDDARRSPQVSAAHVVRDRDVVELHRSSRRTQ